MALLSQSPPTSFIQTRKRTGDITSGVFRNTPQLAAERKKRYAQPAFENNNKQSNLKQHSTEVKKTDSKITDLHNFRVKTAGRVGTKRFVNPCKVFVGNLPFNVTEPVLQDFICDHLGLPSAVIVRECKIIRDWRSGKSKGYGFLVFTEAIYATVCIDKCNNQVLLGRILSVDQGVKKSSTEVFVKKKKRKEPVDEEEAAILDGISEAEDEAWMEPEEFAALRRLDPDLVENVRVIGAEDEFSSVDDMLLAEVGEDEDDGVDGIWEDDDDVEVFDETEMNREQRRNAAKRNKRRKLPYTGFGTAPEE